MKPLLSVKEVSKYFGQFCALNKVSLSIGQGEIRGLIGANGSGKSTLLHVIAGKTPSTSGNLIFEGNNITHFSPFNRVRKGIGIKFQKTNIFLEKTVYENIVLSINEKVKPWRLLFNERSDKLSNRVEELLSRVKLVDKKNSIAGELSHGEKQWLEIAMSMSLEPKLLIFDEPTSGMSKKERNYSAELIRELNSVYHCTILIVEHDIDFIKDVCNKITVLHQGQVLAEGKAEEIEKDERVRDVYLKGGVK